MSENPFKKASVLRDVPLTISNSSASTPPPQPTDEEILARWERGRSMQGTQMGDRCVSTTERSLLILIEQARLAGVEEGLRSTGRFQKGYKVGAEEQREKDARIADSSYSQQAQFEYCLYYLHDEDVGEAIRHQAEGTKEGEQE